MVTVMARLPAEWEVVECLDPRGYARWPRSQRIEDHRWLRQANCAASPRLTVPPPNVRHWPEAAAPQQDLGRDLVCEATPVAPGAAVRQGRRNSGTRTAAAVGRPVVPWPRVFLAWLLPGLGCGRRALGSDGSHRRFALGGLFAPDFAARPGKVVGPPGRRRQRFALHQRARDERIDGRRT